MKHISLALVLLLNICAPLSAQTYHYTFSHDTLGNRVSRVYQGAVPAKGNNLDSESRLGDIGGFGFYDEADNCIEDLAVAKPVVLDTTNRQRLRSSRKRTYAFWN